MITFEMVKPLGALLKKIDAAALMEQLGSIDIKADGAQEKFGRIVLMTIVQHLDEAADPLCELCAAYKGVPVAEMEKSDPIEVLKELFAEEEFKDFFHSALPSAGQK